MTYAYDPTVTEEAIERWVSNRMARIRLLEHPTKPMVRAALDEASLRRTTGGPAVMAEALHHIADLCRRRRIIAQVLPLDAGAHTAMESALKLMDFDDAPPVVYLEGVRSGRLEDDPATVAQLRSVFDLLAASALSPDKSLTFIEALAEDYTHEEP
ncbi:hypothetical protein GCM10010512_40790 [Streptomyces thermoviolaceus subsp. thermoviolaceus]|nr:hypothetical protein GCM10010499_18260 [Streptomyces thermoviolaceus subsp. apingens]GHB05119.1 hypothetical protein GCM10010512_40790 [Streptomyces thermoviolaceus subsp. thermoviolaceus]